MKWNFLYQITAASRTPDKGATAPRSLSSTEFFEPHPDNIPGYATGLKENALICFIVLLFYYIKI